jgi:hypothetical protein
MAERIEGSPPPSGEGQNAGGSIPPVPSGRDHRGPGQGKPRRTDRTKAPLDRATVVRGGGSPRFREMHAGRTGEMGLPRIFGGCACSCVVYRSDADRSAVARLPTANSLDRLTTAAGAGGKAMEVSILRIAPAGRRELAK